MRRIVSWRMPSDRTDVFMPLGRKMAAHATLRDTGALIDHGSCNKPAASRPLSSPSLRLSQFPSSFASPREKHSSRVKYGQEYHGGYAEERDLNKLIVDHDKSRGFPDAAFLFSISCNYERVNVP